MAAVAPSQPSDPELQATAWDLEPLVDGEGSAGVESRLDDALVRAEAFSARYAGKLDALEGTDLREAMQELAVIYELIGRAGTYAALRFSVDTADPANGALLQKAQERATAIETTLLFFELEWAALEGARRGSAGGRGSGLLPPPPAQRAPLPRPPALRARGEDPRREGAHGRRRLGAPVRGAHLGDRGRVGEGRWERGRWARRRRGRRRGRWREGRPGRRAQSSVTARPRSTTIRGTGNNSRPGPRAAHARVRVQHAAGRQGDRRPPAPLPPLAGRAQPRQRGQRRVRAGADRGGARAL